jgi:hypothetical protein
LENKIKLNRNLQRRIGLMVLIAAVVIFYMRYCEKEVQPQERRNEANSRPQSPVAKTVAMAPPVKRVEREVREPKKELPNEATLKSLRSGAKLNLAMIYTAQKSFFSDFKRYSTDLIYVGWAPNVARMNFKLGFLHQLRPKNLIMSEGTTEDPSRMDSDEYLQTPFNDSGDRYHYSKAAESISLFDYEKFCRQRCTANADGFEVLVVLPLGDSGRVDVWSITDKKELRQLWDGVAQKAIEN